MSGSNDSTLDKRFDAAEADVDRGEPWRFRDPNAPNPLTIEASEWSKGFTSLGEAEFLNGIDRNGKRWSVLVGGTVLAKRLVEGLEEAWDDDRKAFVVTATHGRVQPGEVVSMKYLGDKQGAQFVFSDFRVSRKPAPASADTDRGLEGEKPTAAPGDSPEPSVASETDIPF